MRLRRCAALGPEGLQSCCLAPKPAALAVPVWLCRLLRACQVPLPWLALGWGHLSRLGLHVAAQYGHVLPAQYWMRACLGLPRLLFACSLRHLLPAHSL